MFISVNYTFMEYTVFSYIIACPQIVKKFHSCQLTPETFEDVNFKSRLTGGVILHTSYPMESVAVG